MINKSSFKPYVLLLFLFSTAAVQSQNITTPRTPSPAASVTQTIGISTINVNYSRPAVKNREIWGSLVPYGWNVQQFGTANLAPWRGGANENTVISFSHPVKVEGNNVPAGSYGLFFIINKDNSGEVILSKDYKSWGNFFYDPANDLLRSKIQVRNIPNTDLLTYDFINLTKNSAELVLNWEKKQFPVKIEYAVDDIVMDNAVAELKGAMGFGWQAYASAANYSLQNKVRLEQGLQWIDRAITQNKSFTTLSTKANILKAMGRPDEADKIMADALPAATEVEINAYGYQVMGAGNIDKAIEIFVLNTNRFPKSPNVWDSLGEAYVTKGDKKNAIASFKKSLSLNPPANVKANSEKFLQQLGAN
jgi:tetratricopeptide (TPR) repeat protein